MAQDVDMSTSTEQLEDIPYRTKRPHKKSRAGCKNCKTRKVKCNEERPSCRTCRLRKETCVYLTPPANANAASSTTLASKPPLTPPTKPQPFIHNDINLGSPSSSSSSSSVGDDDFSLIAASSSSSLTPSTSPFSNYLSYASIPNPQLIIQPAPYMPGAGEQEMKLMWFYTTVSCTSFSATPHRSDDEVSRLMKGPIVQYAFNNRFLLDTLFALSSYHMHSLGVESKRQIAFEYRTRSYQGYRKAIEEADPASFPALLVNSLLVTALTSSTFSDPDEPDLFIINWMLVWRGIHIIFNVIRRQEDIIESLKGLFNRPPMDADSAVSSIPRRLIDMIEAIPIDDPEYADVPEYFVGLKYLGALYRGFETDDWATLYLRVITWFTFIPDSLCQFLREKRPRALVIVAYYAVFLKMIREIWWVDQAGQRTLQDIQRYLGTAWHQYFDSPLKALQVDDRVSMCRLLLDDIGWGYRTDEILTNLTLGRDFVEVSEFAMSDPVSEISGTIF